MEKTARQQFDDLLKESHFFNDSINTAKRAAGYAAGQILGALIEGDVAMYEKLKRLMAEDFQRDSDQGPSLDSAARLVLHGIQQGLDSVARPSARLQQTRQRSAARSPGKPAAN